MITIIKVVSRNFIMDWVAIFQNMIGKNLSTYEKMMQKGTKQIEEELQAKGIKMKWYRYQISQLTNGSMAIMFYGDEE